MADVELVGDFFGIGSTRRSWKGTESSSVWVTALVLIFLLVWQILRAVLSRRWLRPPLSGVGSTSDAGLKCGLHESVASRISSFVSEEDLKNLMKNFEGYFNDVDRWEDVVDKRNGQISYSAKCYKPKDAPLKYLSVTVFEKCSAEVLRDFYMDNEYRKLWDKTLVIHEQLEVDADSGTEVGRTIKKFPLLTPREYVLVWRVWEGKDGAFYCFIKDCEHPSAPRQKKYVRVRFFRSGWRIRKVPDRDACEIRMVHQEDAGLNTEMAKLAFAKGIWSYVCKMHAALRQYHAGRTLSTSARPIPVPPGLEGDSRERSTGDEIVEQALVGGGGGGDHPFPSKSQGLLKTPSKSWIAKSLLVVGGIVCLSRGHSALGAQLAVACILKKFLKHRDASTSSPQEAQQLSRGRRGHRHRT